MRLDTTVPFTRAEALAAGISPVELAGPRFQRLFHGLYLSASATPTVLMRARAALRISPAGSYVSHHTAGELWGAYMPETTDTHVSIPSDYSRSERRGILAHRADPFVRPVRFRGVMIAPPSRVFLDLAAARVDLVELVAAGDSLVRRQRVSPAELIAAADVWTGRGARLARRAARLVRRGVDSPTESRLRMLIVLAGLPEPEVNRILRHGDGEWSRRLDLCYDELKLVIEYDGRQHLRDPQQWSSDLLRREELERQGWRFVVINAEALYGDPAGTLRRIHQALRDRGCPQLRRTLATAWQRHFPGRPAAA